MKMTHQEFEALKKRLDRLSLKTFDIAYEVLVNGKNLREVADQHGLTFQRVGNIVDRFKKEAKKIPSDWVKIEVWLPPHLATEVKKMADEAITKIK